MAKTTKKKYTIEHLGKVLYTDHYYDLPVEKCIELKQQYYTKPDYNLVKENLKSVKRGGTAIGDIANYYYKDLMAKVKLETPRWSIEEVFESNDLIRYFYSRTLASEKVYPKTNTDIQNLETALRISGGGVAMKPSNFPMQTVDHILKYYNVNNKYYDFSCGWGVRLLSAIKNKVEYYGTDPNNLLVDRLFEMAKDYDTANLTDSKYDIRCQGSEVYVPEWENTIGLAFSSPPYFNLEDYRVGNQSYKPGTTYQQWLDNYLKPTLVNINKYLIAEGKLLVNIKNFSNYKLYEDTLSLAKSLGYHHIQTTDLKNRVRPSAKSNLNTDESIMVLSKNKVEPTGIMLFNFG